MVQVSPGGESHPTPDGGAGCDVLLVPTLVRPGYARTRGPECRAGGVVAVCGAGRLLACAIIVIGGGLAAWTAAVPADNGGITERAEL